MSERYCSSCQTYQNPNGGQKVVSRYGKVVRWRCYNCKVRALQNVDEVKALQQEFDKNNPIES